jgi:hypothetical protein
MAEAMGVAHSTIHRWESAPDTRSGRKALDEARALYKKRTKKDWVPQGAEGGPVTREEFDRLRDDLEDACAVIQFLLSLVPEGSRPGVLPKRFR